MFWTLKEFAKTVKSFVATDDYLEYYMDRKYSDVNCEEDMTGNSEEFEEHGLWQLDYLIEGGFIERDSSLLDFGCGPIRFGRYFLEYKDKEGEYVGLDIHEKAILRAVEWMESNGPYENASVFNNKSYAVYLPNRFDVCYANSVFSHLPPNHIEPAISLMKTNVKEDGYIIFTFYEKEGQESDTNIKGTGWHHPLSHFQEQDIQIIALEREVHPEGQTIVLAVP